MRWSLLAALGLVPLACGGKQSDGDDGDRGGGGGGGKPPRGGTANSGGSVARGEGAAGAVPEPLAGAGGAAGGSAPVSSCTAPELDEATGLVRCREGYLHRPGAKACASAPGAGGEGGMGGVGGANELPHADGSVDCGEDPSVCDAYYLGLCHEQGYGGSSFVCISGCATDDDCEDSDICVCQGDRPGGVCTPSNCHTDADCREGFMCATFQTGCGPNGFACQTPHDECRSDDDCDGTGVCGVTDARGDPGGEVTNVSHRACDSTVCGRPFLIESTARVAPPILAEEWCGHTIEPNVGWLSPIERAQAAEHWTRMGQMEHASIAAFARFNLQLLALGAPPELLEASTRALADETAHAKLCFALASAYAGHAVGPGPLDITGSLAPIALAEVVDLVIDEGCYGETSAALTALEAADAASDPVIAAAYARIARDEQRHAELAFRFVRWAIERSPGLTARVRSAMLSQRCSLPAVQDIVEACLYGVLAGRSASAA